MALESDPSFAHLTTADLIQEIERCKLNFPYFARTYLTILDRNRRYGTLRMNPAQKRLLAAIEDGRVYNLKARKLGMSTLTMAYFFWQVHFNAGMKAGTLAHEDLPAEELLGKVRLMYDNLPNFLKMGEFELTKRRGKHLQWAHGGAYRVASQKSEVFRSADLSLIHFSEFAMYRNPEDTLAATINAALGDVKVVYETTARGMGHAYNCWHEDNGWTKLFFPWTDEASYKLYKPPPVVQQEAIDLAKQHGLSQERMWWFAQKLADNNNNWKKTIQEHPLTATQAFTASEGRVFQVSFPDARVREGIMRAQQNRESYHIYTMGVDVAGGNPSGDYSAWCVLDVTDKAKPVIVSTYYGKPDPVVWSEMVEVEARRYDALLVIETNYRGADMIDRIEKNGYPHFWTEVKYGKKGQKAGQKLGFNTNVASRPILIGNMRQFLGGRFPVVDVTDQRLQVEINDFSYDDKNPDKEQHLPGCHDDMLFAFAMAVEGREQVFKLEQQRFSKRPVTLQEKFSYRKLSGKDYDPSEQFEDDEIDGMFPSMGGKGMNSVTDVLGSGFK